jgi:hypothetical protein
MAEIYLRTADAIESAVRTKGPDMAVTRLKTRLSSMDEVELRKFYESCGLTPATIDRAIIARRGQDVQAAPKNRQRTKARRSIGAAASR